MALLVQGRCTGPILDLFQQDEGVSNPSTACLCYIEPGSMFRNVHALSRMSLPGEAHDMPPYLGWILPLHCSDRALADGLLQAHHGAAAVHLQAWDLLHFLVHRCALHSSLGSVSLFRNAVKLCVPAN